MCIAPGKARRFGLSNAHNRGAVERHMLRSIKKHPPQCSHVDEFNRIRGWLTTQHAFSGLHPELCTLMPFGHQSLALSMRHFP